MRPSPLAALLLLPLTACSSGSTQADPGPSSTAVSMPSAEPTVTPTVSTPPTTTPSVTPSPTTTPTGRVVETAPPPGAPTCKAANLTVTDADTVVTQQTREEVFVIRTNGPDCGLNGFPSVTLKGADGRPLSVTYAHDGSKAAPLSLSRGTSVSFSVTTARAGTCVTAATISVVLPGTGAALTAATSARACGGAVTVSPVRRLTADS